MSEVVQYPSGSSRGILQTLVGELTFVLRIALTKASTPASLVFWFESFGWQIDEPSEMSLVPFLQELTQAIEATGALDFDRPIEEQAGEFQAVITNLIEALAAAKDLPQTLNISGSLDPESAGSMIAQDLLTSYLMVRLPGSFGLLKFLQIIVEGRDASSASGVSVYHEIRFDRLGRLFTDPGRLIADAYGWGQQEFAHAELIEQLRQMASFLGIPARKEALPATIVAQDFYAVDAEQAKAHKALRVPMYEVAGEAGYGEAGLLFLPELSDSRPDGIAISPYLEGSISHDIQLAGPLVLRVGGSLETGIYVGVAPEQAVGGPADPLPPPVVRFCQVRENISDFGFSAELRIAQPGQPMLLLGDSDSTRFELDGLYFKVKTRQVSGVAEIALEMQIDRASLVIARGDGDGFLQKTLPPDDIVGEFDFGIGWSSLKGIYFPGSTQLSVRIPMQLQLGPILLEAIHLQVGLVDGSESGEGMSIDLAAMVTAGVEIGPVQASVEEIGVLGSVALPVDGDPSGADLAYRFKLPKGIGIAIEEFGGGYLYIDDVNGRYDGILELSIGDLSLTAIGLIATQMPDGSKEFSALALAAAEISPGFALGMGFFLSGFGAIAGLNRRINTEAVETAVRDGSVNSILFPENPIANAPKIISDLNKIFPVARDRCVLGAMAMVTWNEPPVVTGQLAIVVEIPEPIRIALLGKVFAILPDPDVEKEILAVRFEIAGVLDTGKKKLSMDAGLVDSHVIDMPLTGYMALRYNWGSNATFLLAVGGVDKSFVLPPDFPKLEPLGIAFGDSADFRLILTSYFAVSSNTVQFGAAASLKAKVGTFTCSGAMSLAVLFQFSPFYFRISLNFSVVIRDGNTKLLVVDLKGMLEGPSPWHITGHAKFEILFISISIPVDEEFGPRQIRTYDPVDPWDDLLCELRKPSGVQTLPIDEARDSISYAHESEQEAVLIVSPLQGLEISQRLLPLGIRLEKFGNQDTVQPMTFDLQADPSDTPTENTTDLFAPGRFRHSSNPLGDPSFESFKSGIRFVNDPPADTTAGSTVLVTVAYEERVDDAVVATPNPAFAPVDLENIERAQYSAWNRHFGNTGRFGSGTAPAVTMGPARYGLANSDDLRAANAGVDEVFDSRTQAEEHLTHHPRAATLQVVGAAEMAR